MKRALTRWDKVEATTAIKKSKRIYSSKFFDIRCGKKTKQFARVLVVTPRKSGKASQRNLFRRRVKALFHTYAMHQGDTDWIFFAKPGIAELSYTQLCDILLKLFLPNSESS